MRRPFAGLNYRHRNAQMAGRASVELHTLIFFRDRCGRATLSDSVLLEFLRETIGTRTVIADTVGFENRRQPRKYGMILRLVVSARSSILQPRL
jgi:hypothetical protein